MFWETFFQDVRCDGTDISKDIDSEVRVHIQSVVPILKQFHCYIYVWRFLFCCFIYILINKYINRVTFYFRFAIVASVPNQDDCVSLIKHKCQNQILNKMKSCLSNSNLFVWVQLRWEVIIHFVDNGGIDDHHCLNFLFIIPI
jgi:hypothetical protein